MMKLTKKQIFFFLGWLSATWASKCAITNALSATITVTIIGVIALIGIMVAEYAMSGKWEK